MGNRNLKPGNRPATLTALVGYNSSLVARGLIKFDFLPKGSCPEVLWGSWELGGRSGTHKGVLLPRASSATTTWVFGELGWTT